MDLNSSILYILGALAGGLWFYRNKYKTEKNITDNMKTKEQLLEKDKEIIDKEGANKSEERKRAEAEETLKKEKGKDADIKSIIDFFNDKLSGK